MMKTGRNDPCPSGTGEKYKKCLARHPCLGMQSSAATIWWVCERWQIPPPPLDELRAALSSMVEICPAKFDAFLEMAFTTSPPAEDYWGKLMAECGAKRHPDLPGVFRRMSDHLSAAGDSQLAWLHSSAATCFRKDQPGMFDEILAATLAMDPATTPGVSLEELVGWALELDRKDDCERLRERFSEFPEYMLEEPEDEFDPDDSVDRHEEDKPDFPPEVTEALDKVWSDFEALDSPSEEQTEAFVEALLAHPPEATPWSDVFDAVRRTGHADIFKIFHRLTSALSPAHNRELAFVCWGAVEEACRRKKTERLPELARGLRDFDTHPCDPDALSHIVDALLAHGFVNEAIEFMIGFLPSLRESGEVMSWVVPRVAEEVFLLRLGTLIASGDYSRQPVDRMVVDLCAGLDEDIDVNGATVPVRHLVQDGESSFSREQFKVPGSQRDPGDQEFLWTGLQCAFVEVARDGWQTAAGNPAVTLVGLHMIYRAAEHWLDSHREKGKKYPPNLLDYLAPVAIERQVAMECADLLGVNTARARIMLDACAAMVRWAGRQGLLAEKDAAKAGSKVEQLLKRIGFSQ